MNMMLNCMDRDSNPLVSILSALMVIQLDKLLKLLRILRLRLINLLLSFVELKKGRDLEKVLKES